MNVIAVRRHRAAPPCKAPDRHGEDVHQHDPQDPQHHRRRHCETGPLAQRNREPRDRESQHHAAGVAHESAMSSAPRPGQVEEEKPDHRARKHDQHLGGVGVADHPRVARQHQHDAEHQASRQAIEPVEHVDRVDDRQRGQHGDRDRPVARIDRVGAEQVAEVDEEVLAPGRHQQRGDHLQQQLGAGRNLAKIVEQADDGEQQDTGKKRAVLRKCPKRECEREHQARRHRDSSGQRHGRRVPLAPAGMVDQSPAFSRSTQHQDQQSGNERRRRGLGEVGQRQSLRHGRDYRPGALADTSATSRRYSAAVFSTICWTENSWLDTSASGRAESLAERAVAQQPIQCLRERGFVVRFDQQAGDLVERDVLDAGAQPSRHHRLGAVHGLELHQAELLGARRGRHAEHRARVVVRRPVRNPE